MLDEAVPLPDDPGDLKALARLLIAEVKAQAVLIEKLRHQLAGHRAHRFGPSGESAEQLQLALEASEMAAASIMARLRLPEDEGAAEPDRPRRRPLPDHIPRMTVEIAPGEDACARCGGRLRRLGEDVTEELEYVPGRFIVNRIVRPRRACSGCERFVQAPLPSRPIERGRPGPGLLAHVLVAKYGDHLPLDRQSQIFEREGIDVDRSTLTDWVGRSTALLEPLADAIGRHVFSAEAIFVDDTPVQMLAPGTGRTDTARLWAYVRDERPWAGPSPPTALAMVLGPVADHGSIPLLPGSQERTPTAPSGRLQRLDARRRRRGLRRALPIRRDPRGRLPGPRPAQVRGRASLAGLHHRRGGYQAHRPALCR